VADFGCSVSRKTFTGWIAARQQPPVRLLLVAVYTSIKCVKHS